jgi:hypothetical protein
MKTKSKVPSNPPPSQKAGRSEPPAHRSHAAGDRPVEQRPVGPQPRVAPAAASASDVVVHEARPTPRPQADDRDLDRERRLAQLVAELQEGRLGCTRVAKALAEFAWATGAKLQEARLFVGGNDFVDWLPRTLGISRREAAALFRFSMMPKFDASPIKAMTLAAALELVTGLCDEYRD